MSLKYWQFWHVLITKHLDIRCFSDYFSKELNGVLLSLEMSGGKEQNVGVTEVLVVASLARQVSISSCSFGIGKEVRTGATTQSQSTHHLVATIIVCHRLAAKDLLDHSNEILTLHW